MSGTTGEIMRGKILVCDIESLSGIQALETAIIGASFRGISSGINLAWLDEQTGVLPLVPEEFNTVYSKYLKGDFLLNEIYTPERTTKKRNKKCTHTDIPGKTNRNATLAAAERNHSKAGVANALLIRLIGKLQDN